MNPAACRVTPLILSGLFAGLVPSAGAAVVPASLFCDHAVLQQGIPIPVWGTADEGEQVTVSLNGVSRSTIARDGKWLVRLPAREPGEPLVMVIEGKNRIEVRDLLVGDVWICSGQSNMERQLGPRSGQKPFNGWEGEVASANYPLLRQFSVEQHLDLKEQDRVGGGWHVCTPDTAGDFSAVGFFFAKALQASRKTPIGLVHAAWGGTPAEAWTSESGLANLPEFQAATQRLSAVRRDPIAAKKEFETDLARWFERYDKGSSPVSPWYGDGVDTSSWAVMKVPSFFEKQALPDFDGIVWYQKEVYISASLAGQPAELHLGAVDDIDSTWVNGVLVGSGSNWLESRVYPILPGILRAGLNRVAVRVLDTGGGGGLWGGNDTLRLSPKGGAGGSISLDGDWRYRSSVDLHQIPAPPFDPTASAGTPTVLYNGMIAPLQPFGIRGVIWYQGEANSGQAMLYSRLFPQLVADWRTKWGQGDFPFLYVQIAPYSGTNHEIREAQRLALDRIPNSAMVVTLDVGDADDIHPPEKKVVGDRLALAARSLAYGESLEYSGPLFDRFEVKGSRFVLKFKHTGKGLVAPGGVLRGFSIAEKDMKFKPAKAVIVGDTVEVSSDEYLQPAVVRYAWENVPEGNLFNKDGLPASSFSTEISPWSEKHSE